MLIGVLNLIGVYIFVKSNFEEKMPFDISVTIKALFLCVTNLASIQRRGEKNTSDHFND